MANAETLPFVNRRLFWDVNQEGLDMNLKAHFIIERVFERGDVEDIRRCRRYYGDKKIAEALLNAKFLTSPAAHLASAIINRPLTDFRCYKNKPSQQERWSF